MSILGVIVRARRADAPSLARRMTALPGAEVALDPGDGRLVVVIDDAPNAEGSPQAAAATLAEIAQWPEVLDTSLVYEYSGPDAPAAAGSDMSDYQAWRGSLMDRGAEGKPSQS